MTNRRSFLGMIAGTPVAAGAIGRQVAVNETLPPAYRAGMAGGGLAPSGDYIRSRVADIRKQLSEIGKDRAERIAEYRGRVTQLDPDIAYLKAFSMSAKVRMQAERNYDRENASRKSWLGKELEELLSSKA